MKTIPSMTTAAMIAASTMAAAQDAGIRIPTNGIELNVKTWGDREAPAVVLMKGWMGTSHTWRKLAPQLADERFVIVPDMRGHGTSDKPEDGYDAVTLAADMRGLLDHFGIEDAHVVGDDMGALVSLALAGTYPEITDHVSHDFTRFERHTMSGYTAEMAEWLRESGRTNVLIGGISIDNCTMHTTLDLLNAGYNVYVVADASSTNSQFTEDVALMRLVQAGATPIGWLAAMTELGWSWDGPYGQGMGEIVAEHWASSTVGPVDDTTPGQGGLDTFAN